ncbi:hypothetical protein [Ferruginibacter albus]|uniref:hypothetical protein n=1 Tax=Ferruginibacter albus TaxID=2875540 RepID=UPI001CC43D94|nr:hypothetical protein [Ferruginibacter albus]UAY53435.1 hypothetical protein K9M53_07115 [Ferruginibacter albus]
MSYTSLGFVSYSPEQKNFEMLIESQEKSFNKVLHQQEQNFKKTLEAQNRNFDRVISLLEKEANTSTRISYIALAIATASLIVAIIALFLR